MRHSVIVADALGPQEVPQPGSGVAARTLHVLAYRQGRSWPLDGLVGEGLLRTLSAGGPEGLVPLSLRVVVHLQDTKIAAVAATGPMRRGRCAADL
eukprot:5390426-Pyramimonas_sp.AAC.1